MTRRGWAGVAVALTAGWAVAGWVAPEALSVPVPSLAGAGPLSVPPFGCDDRGVPLWEYVAQGARIVFGPAMLAGALVGTVCAVAGALACTASGRRWGAGLAPLSELVGALPRWVVVLVVALALPRDARALGPIAVVWAGLALPAAIEEATRAAQRLGADQFVEALRAHGFSGPRIYLGHVVGRNLRALVVRHASEVAVQVVFLEVALSMMAQLRAQPALTHGDGVHSWASLLYFAYAAVLGAPTGHAIGVTVLVLGWVAALAAAARRAARLR